MSGRPARGPYAVAVTDKSMRPPVAAGLCRTRGPPGVLEVGSEGGINWEIGVTDIAP